MQQTAIEWLEQILKQNCGAEFTELNTQIFDKAKEIERQQKEVDYQSGYLDCYTKLMSERLTREV